MRPSKVRKNLRRKKKSHKGDYGHALIVAGSDGMMGAAYLATLAALRSGAGKVTLATMPKVHSSLVQYIPEALSLSLTQYNVSNAKKVIEYANKLNVVAIGPGMGQSASGSKFLKEILLSISLPIIVDADALNMLGSMLTVLKKRKSETILTPHDEEFRRLFAKKMPKNLNDRKRLAKQIANQYDCTLVCKGHRSIVTRSKTRTYVNSSGNPGMATGGTGDVLVGIIAAFIAQGFAPYDATRLGVYVHGRCGDFGAKKKGQAALIASDLIDLLPQVLKSLEKKKSLLSSLE